MKPMLSRARTSVWVICQIRAPAARTMSTASQRRSGQSPEGGAACSSMSVLAVRGGGPTRREIVGCLAGDIKAGAMTRRDFDQRVDSRPLPCDTTIPAPRRPYPPWRSPAMRRITILSAFVALAGLLAFLPAPSPGQAGADIVNAAVVLKGHTETIYAIGFTPDGKYVVTGSFDKSLKMWDAATGKEVKTFSGPQGHQNLVLSLALSPNGAAL